MDCPFLKPLLAALMLAPLGTWSSAQMQATKRVQTVLTAELPPEMNGHRLRTTLIAVQYAPGDSSPAHSHACPVIVYVLEGTVRSQVKGQPVVLYHAGQGFYEPPGGVHLISANASDSIPARFLAFLVCDHDAPLSSDPAQAAPGAKQ